MARGADPAVAELQCRSLGLEFIDVDPRNAFTAAALLPHTTALGLSLGARICLATAESRGVPAVTADRAWGKLAGAVVEVIR